MKLIILFLIVTIMGCSYNQYGYKLSCKQLNDQLKNASFNTQTIERESVNFSHSESAYLYKIYREKNCVDSITSH